MYSPGTVVTPTSTEEVQEAVMYAAPGLTRAHAVRPRGAGTKTALASAAASDVIIDMTGLTGVLEYEPNECTFTARAGTPVREIEALLATHGQALPFEPPFAGRGATLGGSVASGLNGPGRYRFGGVRDFLIGARFVDGEGRLVRGGGKVVKNAAGFYLHHLLLGSLGRLGIFVELTFKVFPAARARRTLTAQYASLDAALARLVELRSSSLEFDALDLEPDGRLTVRLAGEAAALDARAAAVAGVLDPDRRGLTQAVDDTAADRWWADARDSAWATLPLVKVAVTPSRLLALDARLGEAGAERRYSAGGEVAWIGWPADLGGLDTLLQVLGLSGLAVLGPPAEAPILGVRPDEAFLSRVRQTLDPRGTFSGSPSATGDE